MYRQQWDEAKRKSHLVAQLAWRDDDDDGDVEVAHNAKTCGKLNLKW